MGEIVEDDGSEKVEIVLKTIGPTPPSRLRLPSSIKVRDLRRLIASNDHLPIDNLSLILCGTALSDIKNGDDARIQLNDGDSLIIAVRPKPPVRDGHDNNDDDEDLKFQLPRSSSWWKKRLYSFLHDNLKLPGMPYSRNHLGFVDPLWEVIINKAPSDEQSSKYAHPPLTDILLMVIFTLSLKAWVLIIMWFIMAPVAHRWDLGPLYMLATGFCLILFNLGKRQAGDASAYSIFNEDFRELPGTLNADRLDRDIRAGQF